MRDLHIFSISPHRSPRSGGGVANRGVSQPIALKFWANLGRISVKIKLTNRQNRAIYAVSFMQIVALFALIGQMLPIQGNIWILDVMPRQYDLVMHDEAKALLANLTHPAIHPDTFCNIAGTAGLPGVAFIKRFRPRLCHLQTLLARHLDKTKSPHHGSHLCDTWRRL